MSFDIKTAYQMRDILIDRINKRVTYDDLITLYEVNRHIISADDRNGYFTAKWVALKAYKAIRDENDIGVINNLYKLYEEGITTAGREDFEAFCLAMDLNLDVKQRFYEPRRKGLKEIAEELQKLEDGVYDFLSISCPPRVGKTRLSTYFLVWTSARHPLMSNLATSYSDTITTKLHRDALGLMTDPQYRFAEIFPEIRIERSYAKEEAIDLNQARSYHTITCRSVGGSVTGVVECTNLLYCDDLVSGQEEALSYDRMQKLWGEFYPNIFSSRRKSGCKTLCVATRWSVHDPIGKFEQMFDGQDGKKFYVKPALNERDESNFDFPHNLGFSTRMYKEIRRGYLLDDDEVTWLCLYMNEPIERKGLLFPGDKLKYYFGELPTGNPDRVYSFTDVAWGGGDSVSMPIGYEYDGRVYIHEVVFSGEDKTITKPLCAGAIVKNKVQWAEFEANNGGDEFSEDVNELVKKTNHHVNITTKKAPSNVAKLTRIIQHAPDIKGFYYLDPNSKQRTAEYNSFMRELTSFVQTGKNKHDDAPDSLAGLAAMFYGVPMKAEAKVLSRRGWGI